MDSPEAPRGLIVSDLMFGLAAILLLTVAMSLPQVSRLLSQSPPTTLPTSQSLSDLAETRSVILAEEGGIWIFQPARAKRLIPLAALISDGLPPDLTAPLVLITPQATEAAFLLESAAAQLGIPEVEILILPPHCPHISAVNGTYRCN